MSGILVTRTGDAADRRLWRMQGGGGRESYKRTRLRTKLPQYAPITFQGRELAEFDSPFSPKQKNQPSPLT